MSESAEMSSGMGWNAAIRIGGVSAAFGLTLLFAACRENVVAPGACPDFCPNRGFSVVDTILLGTSQNEEWASGYQQPYEASAMQVVRDSATRDSWGLIRFIRFSDSLLYEEQRLPILSLDSFQLSLEVLATVDNVEDLELVVYRVPTDIDNSTTYDDMVPYFQDSTRIATIPVPDTLTRVAATLPPDAFPTFVEDSLQVAVGLALTTDSGGFVDLSTRDGGNLPAILTLYASVEHEGDTVDLTDSREPAFDTYVAPAESPPGPDALGVGGIPSSRAILRVNIPRPIADSSDIVRATLILVPEGPALGAPGDTVMFQVFGLRADIGVKSPYAIPQVTEGVIPGAARIPVGSSDTIRVDITHIVRPWQSDTTLAHSLMLVVVPEAATLGEVRVLSSSSAAAPSLHITYVPLFLVEEL